MREKRANWLFFVIYFLFWLGENCLAPYLGIFYEARGLDGVQIGFVSSAFSIAVILAALAVGAIGDRIGRPTLILLLLCVGMICSTGLLYGSRTYAFILAAVVLYGASYSPFNGIADKLLMARIRETPALFGRYRMGGTIGAGVGVLIAAVLVSKTDSYFPLFLVYWAAAACCMLVVLRLPRQIGEAQERASLRDYLYILRHRRFFPIYFTMAVWGFTESTMTQFLALHIVASGFPETYTSFFVAFAMAGEALMFALVPRISVALGSKKTLALAFLLQFFRIGSLACIHWLPLPLVAFLQFTGGGAYASVYSMMTQEIDETFPSQVGCSAHTMKLVVNRGVGVTCGALLLGWFYQKGRSAAAYSIFAVTALLYAALQYILSKKKNYRSSPQ